jgi:hypothetical protein
MNTRFQIAIVILLGLILAAIVIPAAVTYWQTSRSTIPAAPPQMTPSQYKMVLQGYVRDHATHQWISRFVAMDQGCTMSGTVIETTFNNCRTPLTGGIPDQEQQH